MTLIAQFTGFGGKMQVNMSETWTSGDNPHSPSRMHQVQLEGLPTQLRKQEKKDVLLEQGKKQKLFQRLLPCEGHRFLQQMRQSRKYTVVSPRTIITFFFYALEKLVRG